MGHTIHLMMFGEFIILKKNDTGKFWHFFTKNQNFLTQTSSFPFLSRYSTQITIVIGFLGLSGIILGIAYYSKIKTKKHYSTERLLKENIDNNFQKK